MVGRKDSYGLGSNDKINLASTYLVRAPVYPWSAKSLQLLGLPSCGGIQGMYGAVTTRTPTPQIVEYDHLLWIL